jgi:hypothetical protein
MNPVDASDAMAEEGVSSDDKIEFLGEVFQLPEKVAFWAFVIFGKAAKSGLSTDDDAGLAAMYDMVHGSLREEDGERFDKLALEKRPDAEEIFDFIKEIMERVSSRPTGPPSGSSSRGRKTSMKSKAPLRPDGAEDLIPVGEALR